MSTSYIENLAAKAGVYSRTMQAILSKAEAESRSLTTQEQADFAGLETKAKAALESVETAKRSASLLSVPGAPEVRITNNNQADAPWDSRSNGTDLARGFGEFLTAVRAAETPGGYRDARLEKRSPSGQSESFLSDGGYLVGGSFSAEIFKRAYSTGAILSRVHRIPIGEGFNGIKIPYVDETSRANGSRSGAVRSYWVPEGETLTASKVKFGRHELELKKLTVLGHATSEMLQDRPALGSILLQAFSDEVRFATEDSIIRGSGAGMPLGVLNSPALVTVSKESTQSTASIVFENAAKAFARLWPGSVASAVWLANAACMPSLLAMNTGGSNAQPLFLMNGNAANGPQRSLLGCPLIFTEYASALGTPGDLLLVDLSQYAVADKPAQAAESMHVRFLYDEQTFRLTYRVDGQPLWHQALTPYKGADAISPFIALAARP